MKPDFWNERYRGGGYAYGMRPNDFLAQEVRRLTPPAEVVELGAGEGRNAVFFAEQGFRVTAVDYAAAGLAKTRRLAQARGVPVETVQADLLAWQPDRRWDAVLVTFLHLPPEDRPALYRLVHQILRPGGLLLAEWFTPEQVTAGYASGGPKSAEMMVPPDELRLHFEAGGIRLLETRTVELDEGPYHQGTASVVRFVWQQPANEEPLL